METLPNIAQPNPSPLRVGDRIPIPELAKEAITTLAEEDANAQVGLQHFAALHRAKQKKLWKAIRAAMPQCQGWEMSFNHKDNELTLLFPKDE